MQSVKRLFGLVVCGGQSSRMGTDKSLLVYHGRPQREYMYTMLATLCDETFFSCNREQAKAIDKPHKVIVDAPAYAGNGPIAGLLSAFDRFPGADWLVAGCDYPYISRHDLNSFIKTIDTSKTAAAFYNANENLYEPVLAWYSYPASDELRRMFAVRDYSLQHFLQKTNAGKFIPHDNQVMQSVNTVEEFQQVKKDLTAEKHPANPSQSIGDE